MHQRGAGLVVEPSEKSGNEAWKHIWHCLEKISHMWGLKLQKKCSKMDFIYPL
jgi:hypothetical protein